MDDLDGRMQRLAGWGTPIEDGSMYPGELSTCDGRRPAEIEDRVMLMMPSYSTDTGEYCFYRDCNMPLFS